MTICLSADLFGGSYPIDAQNTNNTCIDSSIQLDEIRKQRLTLLYKSKREHKLLVSIKVSIKILKNKLLIFFSNLGWINSAANISELR